MKLETFTEQKKPAKGSAEWAGMDINELFFAMNRNGDLEGPYRSREEAEEEFPNNEWVKKGSELGSHRREQAKERMKNQKKPLGYFDRPFK